MNHIFINAAFRRFTSPTIKYVNIVFFMRTLHLKKLFLYYIHLVFYFILFFYIHLFSTRNIFILIHLFVLIFFIASFWLILNIYLYYV